MEFKGQFYPIIHPKYYNTDLCEMTYLEMPKSGCSSIIRWMGWNPRPNADAVPLKPVFTVIRDPVDRFVSGFMQLKRMEHAKGAETIDDFVQVLERFGWYDRHIVPQSEFIRLHYQTSNQLTIYPFNWFMPRLNVHLNRTDPATKPIPTDRQVKMIREWYRDDYKYLFHE